VGLHLRKAYRVLNVALERGTAAFRQSFDESPFVILEKLEHGVSVAYWHCFANPRRINLRQQNVNSAKRATRLRMITLVYNISIRAGESNWSDQTVCARPVRSFIVSVCLSA
jgi:hypothetical protein